MKGIWSCLTRCIALSLFVCFSVLAALRSDAQGTPNGPSQSSTPRQTQSPLTGQTQSSTPAQTVAPPGVRVNDAQVRADLNLGILVSEQVAPLLATRNQIVVNSLSRLRQVGDVDRQILSIACADPASNLCAEAAAEAVKTQCMESARFFKRDAKGWRVASFVLVLSSAAFTAVGASTTLANAKVFSTLGGTTALGAATAQANSNFTTDLGGMATITTTLANFEKLIQSGGKDNAPAPNDLIYKSAPAYEAQCYAAAAAATGVSGK